jgi:hypothetical protein
MLNLKILDSVIAINRNITILFRFISLIIV